MISVMKPIAPGAGCADAVAKDSLENQRDDHRAPADEDGGGIKIRDRRAFLQIHARNQPEGVDDEREQEQIKRGAIQRPVATPATKRRRTETRAHTASCCG